MKSLVRQSILVLAASSFTVNGFSAPEKETNITVKNNSQKLTEFDDLVTMQEWAVTHYDERPAFGVKMTVNDAEGEPQTTYGWMSYREFGKQVDRLRGGFAGLGVAAGDKVAIISDNSPEWAISCYATLGLGAAFVSMYTHQHPDVWKFKVRHSDAKILLTANKKIYEKVKGFADEIPSLEKIILISEKDSGPLTFKGLQKAGKKHPVASVKPSGSDLMGLIYTSGTTGTPKGVMISHENVTSLLKVIPELVDLEGQKSLSFLPWAHIFGQLGELHALLLLGNSTALVESTKTIRDDMKLAGPSVLFSVPTMFNRVYDGIHKSVMKKNYFSRKAFENWKYVRDAEANGQKPNIFWRTLADYVEAGIRKTVGSSLGGNLKYAVSGGSKLDPKIGRFLSNLGVKVLEGYGMSETTGLISVNTLTHNRMGSVGKPVPGVELRFDHEKRVSEDPAEGEIIVCGPNIMMGYYKLPKESYAKDMTEDGCFRTGDLGKLDEDGYLFITGRVKEIYKLENGKYVVPTVLENNIKRSPYFREAFLYGDNKPYNVMLALPDTGKLKHMRKSGMSEEQILEEMNAEIAKISKTVPRYEAPKKYKVLLNDDWNQENGLLTATQKMRRRHIYKHYRDLIEGFYN